MGFNDTRARRVLKHFRNDLDLAMDFLINTPVELDHILDNGPAHSNSRVNLSLIIYNSLSQTKMLSILFWTLAIIKKM